MVHSFASLERMRKEMGTKQFTKLVGEELIPSRTGMATEALKVIINKNNYPLLVTCKTGKNLTGMK
jgi:hypothetical protein